MQYALIGIIIILGILLFLKKEKTPDKEKTPYQYKKKIYFFSKNELNFYRELDQKATELNLILFSKVRLADIVEPIGKGSNWQSQFNRIRSKHVDFILCDLPSIKPVLVIELDDNSHNKPDRQERDTFVDRVLEQAGIPIIHTKDSSKIDEKIKATLANITTVSIA